MLNELFQNHSIQDWVIFPLFIFLARMTDVTLGTLRTVLAAKGNKKVVPFIGFFEVLIWLFAISQIMQNLTNVISYLAWAGGYAMGSYLGLTLEEKLAMGTQVMRIITNQNCDELVKAFKSSNYGLTVIDGQGARGPVKLIFTVVKRKEVGNVIKLINLYTPNAFYSIEDTRDATQVGYIGSSPKYRFFRKLFPISKDK